MKQMQQKRKLNICVTAKFLDPEENGQRNRPKRESPVAAAVAVDAIALFGSLGVSRQVLKDAE